MQLKFADISGFPPPGMQAWAPFVIRKATIERLIEALAQAPRPDNNIRATRIVHPEAPERGQGLAPTIACSVHVLRPGESTEPMRHNASEVSICVGGTGAVSIGAQSFAFERHDVWNTPAMHTFAYRNTGRELMARICFSNAALLEMMGTHYVEHLGDSAAKPAGASAAAPPPGIRALPAPIMLENGAQLLTYEYLISPEVVENKALHWRWQEINACAERMFGGGKSKQEGRRGLFVLFNPATGRLAGATHSFFATLGFMPGETMYALHRHSSSAVNYCVRGDVVSEVNGQMLDWSEGDISYTAPSWSAHANGSKSKGGGVALTIQDHPLQIATESLIWQEGEGKPIRLLGAEPGFEAVDPVNLGA